MLTYLLAVLAAGVNAVSSVLQRKANRDLPNTGDSLRPGLILELLRHPVWCAGMAGVVLGFLLQAAALDTGELAVVEPILVLDLPLTLVIASRAFHAPLRHVERAAALGMAAGLAGLLCFLAPQADSTRSVSWQVWLVGVGVNLAVVGAAVEWGRRAPAATDQRRGSDRRAAAFAVAAGCQFGLTAALIKSTTDRYNEGFDTVFTSWPVYAMMVSGLLGLFLMQSAMNAGRLIAAQPGLTLSDPLVSILWGVLVFGERVRGGLSVLAAALCGGVMVASVLVLVRSPALGGGETPSGDAPPPTGDTHHDGGPGPGPGPQ